MYSCSPDELMKSIKTLGNGVLLPPDPFKRNPRQVGRQSNLQVPKFPEKDFPNFRGSKNTTEISLAKSNTDATKRQKMSEISKPETSKPEMPKPSEISVLQNSKVWTNKDHRNRDRLSTRKKRKSKKDFRLSVSDFERYFFFSSYWKYFRMLNVNWFFTFSPIFLHFLGLNKNTGPHSIPPYHTIHKMTIKQ